VPIIPALYPKSHVRDFGEGSKYETETDCGQTLKMTSVFAFWQHSKKSHRY